MYSALFIASIYISIYDIRRHKITNGSLITATLVFLTMMAVSGGGVYPLSLLVVLILAPFLLRWGIGAGDIKLLFVLSIFFIEFSWWSFSNFLLAFSLISALSLIVKLAKSHSFAGSIALAPAICGAVIWCAR